MCSAASELFQAIREALQGRAYVTPLATHGMIESLTRNRAPRKDRHKLTPRQREVCQLLAEGHTMKEIGALLHVTPRTVAFHKYEMMKVLGLTTNAELIQFAVKNGLVSS